jgi:hypothetical protein
MNSNMRSSRGLHSLQAPHPLWARYASNEPKQSQGDKEEHRGSYDSVINYMGYTLAALGLATLLATAYLVITTNNAKPLDNPREQPSQLERPFLKQ